MSKKPEGVRGESSRLAWDVARAGGKVVVGLVAARVAIRMTVTDGSYVSQNTMQKLHKAAGDLGLDVDEPDIVDQVTSMRPYKGKTTWPRRRSPIVNPNIYEPPH
jgi:hypothetical protein